MVHSLSQILYSLEDVIGKKALIDEFLSPYSLLMFKGIYELIILLIFSVPFLFVKIDGIIIFSKMYIYINSFLKVFFYFILMVLNFMYNIFIWIIIDRFSPNDYAMAMIIESISDKIFILIFQKDFQLYLYVLSIVIYIILIIGVCIYSEIIVIKICGLNEYTRGKLGIKGDEDVELSRKSERSLFSSFDDKDIIQKKNRGYSTKIKYKKRNSKEINPNLRKLSFKINSLNPLFENQDDKDD